VNEHKNHCDRNEDEDSRSRQDQKRTEETRTVRHLKHLYLKKHQVSSRGIIQVSLTKFHESSGEDETKQIESRARDNLQHTVYIYEGKDLDKVRLRNSDTRDIVLIIYSPWQAPQWRWRSESRKFPEGTASARDTSHSFSVTRP
jgi:hypothetical protein